MHSSNFTLQQQQILLERLPPTPPKDADSNETNTRRTRPFFLASLFQPQRNTTEKASKKDPSRSPEKFAREAYNPRDTWHVESIVEVYSRSYDAWFTGSVEGIGYDEDGEFFEVRYLNHNNGKSMIKYINRFDTHLRSIETRTPVLKMPADLKNKKNERPLPIGMFPAGNSKINSRRTRKDPKRNSVNKKPLPSALNQKGLLPQSVIDELLKDKENFGTSRSYGLPDAGDGSELNGKLIPRNRQEVIDELTNKKGLFCGPSNMQSSVCSEALRQEEIPLKFREVKEVDDDDQKGGDDCSETSDEESSARLAWLNAEEFESFFRCRLSGFLRRVAYYE